MTPLDVLADAFDRIHDTAHAVLDGLDDDALRHRPGPDANPIGWLVWHLARVQDDHLAGVAELAGVAGGGSSQVYADFVERFALPYDESSIGYGHSSEEVGAFAAPAGLIADYLDAVHRRTREVLAALSVDDLDRVVDEDWDPPVTVATRLVSVVSDDLQHVGQAAYVRGLLPG